MKFFSLSVMLTALLAVNTADLKAQMFSVGSDPGRVDVPATAIYAGWETADFKYKGGSLDEPVNEGRFAFSGSLIRFRFETPGLELFLGSGGSLTGMDDVTYFDAGVQAGYNFSIVRNQRLRVQIPLQFISSLTNVSTDQSIPNAPQFRQGALVAGTGGVVAARPSDRIRLHAEFIPYYGFSFSTGSTFGGSLAKLEGKFRFFLDRVFGDTGLSFGYNYNFNRFDVDEDEFDYDLRSHSILVGITF